jgi:hypothetical protein
MTENRRACAQRSEITLLIRLLIDVSRQIDRVPPQTSLDLSIALGALASQLNTHYCHAGSPYGDGEDGFRRWIFERWPAPPAA